MRKVGVVALAVALSAMLLATTAVVGKKVRPAGLIPSTLTLENPEPGVYEGVIKSRAKKCFKRRKVTVYHDENGNGIDSTDFKIGSDKTDHRGEYVVEGNQAPKGDTIIAMAATRKVRKGSHCLSRTKSAKALGG